MSTTPPDNQPSAANPGGDGVAKTPTDARGAQRTGRAIWILAISTAAAAVILIGFFLLSARHMHSAGQRAGGGLSGASADTNPADANSFHTPPSQPKPTAPGGAANGGTSSGTQSP